VAPEPRVITIVEGDDIAFSRVENAEEFSRSRVAQIAQDDKGFMWFGTAYGLNRFDGYGYTLFAGNSRVPNQLSGVYVSAIAKDRSGRLWIASDQGLDTFDPDTGMFGQVVYASAPTLSTSIQSIYEDRSGAVWLSTSAGLYGLDSSGRTRVRFLHDAANPVSLGSNDVKSAQEGRDGTFWITNGAGLEAIDRVTGNVLIRVPLRERREIRLIEDRRGTLWIYHANGLATFDRMTRTLTSVAFLDDKGKSIPGFGVFAALEDRDGTLWFGTGGQGLLRFDTEHQHFVRYRSNSGDPQSLAGDDVSALFQDRQDNIWVAFHGTSLNLFPARKPSFRKLPARPGAANERAEKMVNSILELDEHTLWISYIGMLLGVDGKTGDRENLSQRWGLDSDVISMARDARGRVWLGTVRSGLLSVDAAGRVSRYRHDPEDPGSIADDTIDGILVDHAQNIWVATWGGLSRFDEKRGKFESFRPRGMDPKYLALAEDSAHQLWLATHLYGLQRFNPATGEFVTYPATGAAGSISNGRVNAVHVGRSGIIWAGTQNGLDALNPTTGNIRNYHVEDGLPGNAVSCILEDDRGGLWLGTNNGIARLDAHTGEVNGFTRADGLPGTDFTGWGSCDRGVSKEMYFAGFTGATAFEPERVRALSYSPSVEFTDLIIAGRPYPEGTAAARPAVLPALREVTLPYSRNTFSAGFTALSYANARSNRFRFRLAGLEEQWHAVGSDRRVASYNSLPPGRYRLEVQGATSAGPWSAIRTLELTILKPWWQTTIFRVAIAFLMLGIALSAYRLRVRHVTRQFEMRLDERVAERTRIARELHDSLLQGFQGLMFRLQAVRNLLPLRPQEAAQALDAALSRGDETVEEARVAVTDLRTFGSGESDLETALREMAHDVALMSRADAPEYRVLVTGERRNMIPLVRDDVLQVAREAFRNVLLHARARVVQVDVIWGDERFILRVRDDGVGLDPKMIAHGRDGHWGLQGMRERTRQVGGSLEIRSEGNSGTVVELSVPAARVYSR
jgi:ligand-binding sensor domain-containing protein/signal transduction histidine kinase